MVSLAPQAEQVPFSVIFGCSFTSAPQTPHFGILISSLGERRFFSKGFYDIEKGGRSPKYGHIYLYLTLSVVETNTFNTDTRTVKLLGKPR